MFLTIFTPAYNRADLLKRLYESLVNQTNQDFEWLCVNDGSVDNTDEVMQGFINEGKLKIKYIKKENGGKHRAHNRALKEAEGEFFFCVDSDDYLKEDAVEQIALHKSKMTEKDWAIAGYKELESGKLICKTFPKELLKGEHFGFYDLSKKGVFGEFSIVLKTDIAKENPFPEIDGERFMTEAVLYDSVDKKGYTVCPMDRSVTVCEYQEGGLTSSPYKRLVANPVTYQLYYMGRIDMAKSFKVRVSHMIKYNAFRFLSKNKDYKYKGKHKVLCALLTPIGFLAKTIYTERGR